jgi:ribose transport system permease protein
MAGIIESARLVQVDPSMGQGYELIAIAIAVLGGASIFGGYGSIEGTMLGALIIGVLHNLFNLLGWSGYTEEIFVAIIIIVATSLQRFSVRK